MHLGGDTVEINVEPAGSDITEYTLTNDKPSAGMFGFLYYYIVCINFILFLRMQSYYLLRVFFHLYFNRTQLNIGRCLEVIMIK